MPAVIYEKKGRIAYITLNRPEVMNAINMEAQKGLNEAWANVRDDPDVWIAIVTGTGDRAFSAGADLKEIAALRMQAEQGGGMPEIVSPLVPMRSPEVYKPFIAAINGIATGGGLELALICDIRIAADSARLGLREVVQAVMPGWGGTQRLPRLVPFGIALEILMTGDFISAQEAYRIGLVNKVVPLDELMPTAEALANRINENGPLAVRAVKEAAYRGVRMSLDEGLRLESLLMQGLMTSEDAKEGPLAFVMKRKPEYKGR
ncbi:MAG: enoyl-CoA hydratase/isomerase family protein [Dehalococcoidia bacterium]|nr:enoyl-CoA hydratase/isomerase family protein [Dehalococcoidia bacterium]